MKNKGKTIRRFFAKAIRLTTVIFLLLYFTFFANLSAFDWAPESMKLGTAHAADPNMMLFWDGNCASPPSGWTVVSDGAGEAFYDAVDGGLFPRGNSSYSRYAGGAPTHTHTGTLSQTATTGTTRTNTSANTQSTVGHTHTFPSPAVDSISSLPAYKNLCVIQYSGIPTGATAIPSGAIAIFDGTVPASNWSDYSSTFGTNYIRGNSSAGGTGGSNSHAATGHTVSGMSFNASADSTTRTGSTGSRSSTVGHTHTVANQTSDTPATEPQYVTVILGKATANTSIPQKMIAMFDNTSFSSYGWEVLSNAGGPFYQKFLKVTGTYGSTGGADQHTHAAMTGTTGSSGGDQVGGNGTAGIQSHTHGFSASLADGTGKNNPQYTDVVIAKRSYVFTTLTATNAPNPGDTVTVDAQVNNDSATNLSATHIKYIIFIDTSANGIPDVGETYITANCAGSGVWASEANYTWEKTALDVNAGSFATDQQSCQNTNFPSVSTYTVWGKWHNSGDTITYDTKSTTFSSVPTLGTYLLIILMLIAAYLAYRRGYISLTIPSVQNSKKVSSLALNNKARDLVLLQKIWFKITKQFIRKKSKRE